MARHGGTTWSTRKCWTEHDGATEAHFQTGRPRSGCAGRRPAGDLAEMRGEARLRAERLQHLQPEATAAAQLHGDVQRDHAVRVRAVEARARDGRRCRIVSESLLLLPRGAWRGGAHAVGRSGTGRDDGAELSRGGAGA